MSKMCVLSKNNMKLSVIVAIYNIEMYVEKCVRSVMCQTYKNLEMIEVVLYVIKLLMRINALKFFINLMGGCQMQEIMELRWQQVN